LVGYRKVIVQFIEQMTFLTFSKNFFHITVDIAEKEFRIFTVKFCGDKASDQRPGGWLFHIGCADRYHIVFSSREVREYPLSELHPVQKIGTGSVVDSFFVVF